MNLFIIDFNETASNEMLLIFFASCKGDDLTKGSRDNTFGILIIIRPHHSMSFSTTSLTISEDGSIISLQYIIN